MTLTLRVIVCVFVYKFYSSSPASSGDFIYSFVCNCTRLSVVFSLHYISYIMTLGDELLLLCACKCIKLLQYIYIYIYVCTYMVGARIARL